MGALMPSRSQDWVDVTPIVAVCSDLFGMFLFCTLLYCIVLYCIVLYCIVLYRILMCSIVPRCAELYEIRCVYCVAWLYLVSMSGCQQIYVFSDRAAISSTSVQTTVKHMSPNV